VQNSADPTKLPGGRVFVATEGEAALLVQPNIAAGQTIWLPRDASGRFTFDLRARPIPAHRTAAFVRLRCPPHPAKTKVVRLPKSADWQPLQVSLDLPPNAAQLVASFGPHGRWPVAFDDALLTLRNRQGLISAPGLYQLPGERWSTYQPAASIKAGSPLDCSQLLEQPAGRHGFLTARGKELVFADGFPARLYGTAIPGPTCFLDPPGAEALADRLAVGGLNLAYLSELDNQDYPYRNLLANSLDETQTLSAPNLERLDYLTALLRRRGIYYALELHHFRRFRAEDDVAGFRNLPPGGGFAALFAPRLRELETSLARALLTHVNPHTRLPYAQDPALAFVVLTDGVDLDSVLLGADPDTEPYRADLRKQWNDWLLARYESTADLRKAWTGDDALQADEDPEQGTVAVRAPISGARSRRRLDLLDFLSQLQAEHFGHIAAQLRTAGVKAPVVSSLSQALGLMGAAPTIDWGPHASAPRPAGGRTALRLLTDDHTDRFLGAPDAFDGRLLLATGTGDLALAWRPPSDPLRVVHLIARWGPDTGALVSGALAGDLSPWGDHWPGSRSSDLVSAPRAANARLAHFAQWPVAARAFHRRDFSQPVPWPAVTEQLLTYDSPRTQGAAGSLGQAEIRLSAVTIRPATTVGAITISTLDDQPLTTSRHVLIAAVGRSTQAGARYLDPAGVFLARLGHPPLLFEPVRARLIWRRQEPVAAAQLQAWALAASGERTGSLPATATDTQIELALGDPTPALHYEVLIAP